MNITLTEKEAAVITTALESQKSALVEAKVAAIAVDDTASSYCFKQEIARIDELLARFI